ncbi:MAG: ATP-binding protein [Tepidisphaeraceae bacterium]|jgi:two-component system, sensor histidine kinase RegB
MNQTTAGNRVGLSAAVVEEPGIVLQWLVRLRWVAFAGQVAATAAAMGFLKIRLPWWGMGTIIGVTGVSNLILQGWLQRSVPGWVVPAVLMLDVLLLTALLGCAGGGSNPFCILYVVHVAMAVVTLAEGWAWAVVGATIVCYGLLLWGPGGSGLALSPGEREATQWIALALVAVVIAYFVGRMTQSLREHEEALVGERERGERNERLASLTTLAAGAAHELNTPLSTIAVVARELEIQCKKMGHGEEMEEDARLIRSEIDRCQVILSRMRVDVLQGDWGKSAPMSSADFVRELSKEIKCVAGDGVEIDCAGNLPDISLPLRAVEQAVGILVDNALEASPKGSLVRLSIASREGRVVFEVRDQGTGMTPEVVRRAGEPFFTTKSPGKGMGMGLFLVRLVAEKLGGSLRLESEPGKGTRAVLELPAGAG